MKIQNNGFKEQLAKELKLSGALQKEVEGFYPVLDKLSNFSKVARPYLVKRDFLERTSEDNKDNNASFFWPKMVFAPAAAFGLLIVIGAFSVFASQESLPGDPLYSLKRFSENVTSSLRPEFEDEKLLRRSREVRELVEKNKDEDVIEKAMEEYDKERKKKGHNVVKIEESRLNIEYAREKAGEEIRKSLEERLKTYSLEKDNSGSKKDSENNEDSREGKSDSDSEDSGEIDRDNEDGRKGRNPD